MIVDFTDSEYESIDNFLTSLYNKHKKDGTIEEAEDFIDNIKDAMIGIVTFDWDLKYEEEPTFVIGRSIGGCVADALIECGIVDDINIENANKFWNELEGRLMDAGYIGKAE